MDSIAAPRSPASARHIAAARWTMTTHTSRRPARGSVSMTTLLSNAISDDDGARAAANEGIDGAIADGAIAGVGSLNARGGARGGARGADGGEIPNGSLAMGELSSDVGARGAKRSREGAIGGRSSGAVAGRGGNNARGGKGNVSMEGFPGTVLRTDDVVGRPHGGEMSNVGFDVQSWDKLCEKRFADKKAARLAALEWYSNSSTSSARLIVDKWRESKVRYVLRCQTAMPKRSEKSNKDVCQSKGSMCPMCVHVKFDRATRDWAISREDSVPTHSVGSCADSRRPNATSVQFAAHLKGLDKVSADQRQSFIARALDKSGYKITSGTKQRAVALALGKKHRPGSLGQ